MATPAPPVHHFDATDALAAASLAAPVLGHGAGDLAGYMMSRSALESLEASGQGDSAMADMARTGLAISKVKITVSCIFGGIFLIIFLVVLSHVMSAQSQFNSQFNNPGGGQFPGSALHEPLAAHLRALVHGARAA
jgi:hypothetical protein